MITVCSKLVCGRKSLYAVVNFILDASGHCLLTNIMYAERVCYSSVSIVLSPALATKGIPFSGCPAMCLSVIIHWMLVNAISYKSLVGIPNVQHSCTWGQRWIDWILRSKIKVRGHCDDQVWSEITSSEMHLSGEYNSVLWHCWLGHLTRKNPSPIWPIMCLVGR